jgi:NADPH:quinone reductase-like Zn-dependent oxidoreductase
MRQIWIRKPGGPEVLEVREADDPEPGPGQVRIRVHAAGVNFADLMGRMGTYPDAPGRSYVPGYEVAGTIDAVGEGVDAARVGERVAGMIRFGGYADVIVVDAVQAVRLPDGVSLEMAAGVPVTGLTAWMLLEVFGRVRAGDRVLVHSAGGGVGLMALDLIKRRGATAIGTASEAKHERLRERGYDQLIDYRTEDFEAVLADAPVDLILDPVGGESWAKGLRILRSGGQLGCFGFSAANTGETRSLFGLATTALAVPWLKVNPVTLMNENRGVYGVNMGHLWDEAERVAGWLEQLFALWSDGTLRPHVDRVFPFEDASEAHQYIHDRKNFGKVVLKA